MELFFRLEIELSTQTFGALLYLFNFCALQRACDMQKCDGFHAAAGRFFEWDRFIQFSDHRVLGCSQVISSLVHSGGQVSECVQGLVI